MKEGLALASNRPGAAVDATGAAVTFHGEGPLALVTLGSPSGRPLLTGEVLASLAAALDHAFGRDDIALVLLCGGGRAFCLGADLDHLRAASDIEAERYLRQGQSVTSAIVAAQVPVVAAVSGLAFGGGFELALACDLRWADRRAVFALPEARAGLIPAWGAGAALARELPGACAWELLVGGRLGARRATELGLVGRLFEGGDFQRQAIAAAQEIAGLGRATLAGLKAVWRAGLSGDIAKSGRLERDICLRLRGRPGVAPPLSGAL